jgi:hypothetical protein
VLTGPSFPSPSMVSLGGPLETRVHRMFPSLNPAPYKKSVKRVVTKMLHRPERRIVWKI